MASQWPPRSPHEALLSTPGGREKLRRLAERQSPSPSPSKLRSARSAAALASLHADLDDDLDDDDDEETLQLKLQAIQAKLRLKKLQSAKAQQKAGSTAGSDAGSLVSRPESRTAGTGAEPSADVESQQGVPLQSRLAAVRDRNDRQISQNSIQVPASPVRKVASTAALQTSPQRILLGIDKGRKASEVSLKRAPSMKRGPEDAHRGGY
jgi:minichromosome maintenance protein 10